MGFVLLLGLGAVALGLVLLLGRPTRGGLLLTLAALLVAAAGYAWQGRPGLDGVSRSARERPPVENEGLITLRRELNGERIGFESAWLDMADGMIRTNNPRYAVGFIQSALRQAPRSAALWTGLGNALIAQGEGKLSPAASFAFERAHQLSPDHPGPLVFYGLALAGNGELDRAEALWRRALATAPPGISWRPKVELLVARAELIRSASRRTPSP